MTLKLRKGVRLTQRPTDMKELLEGALNLGMKSPGRLPSSAPEHFCKWRTVLSCLLASVSLGPTDGGGRVGRTGSPRVHPSFPPAGGGRTHGLVAHMGTRQPRVGEIPVPPLMSSVTSSKWLHLAEPQFSSSEKAAQIISPKDCIGRFPHVSEPES